MLATGSGQVGMFDAAVLTRPLPEGSFFALLAEHGDRIVRDEDFADCYSQRMGRPSIRPSLLAKVLLLQHRTGASDEAAMEAVAWDLRWKVALGLAVDHQGWHPTSLTKFRARLLLHGKEQVALLTSLLDGLPPSLRHAASYPVPTIEQVFDRDPTEGVRAKLIPDFLRIYFQNVDERRLGGTILHPIFPFINVDSFRDQPDFHQAYMNLLIELDGQLIADGKSDFSFFICR